MHNFNLIAFNDIFMLEYSRISLVIKYLNFRGISDLDTIDNILDFIEYKNRDLSLLSRYKEEILISQYIYNSID